MLSSNENFLLFGGNCKEDCIPMRRFIDKLVDDIDYVERPHILLNIEAVLLMLSFEYPNCQTI